MRSGARRLGLVAFFGSVGSTRGSGGIVAQYMAVSFEGGRSRRRLGCPARLFTAIRLPQSPGPTASILIVAPSLAVAGDGGVSERQSSR